MREVETISDKGLIVQKGSPFVYRYIYKLGEDFKFVNANGKAGLYDIDGNMKLPFEYDSIYNTYYSNYDPEENKYMVIKDGKVGTVDIYNNNEKRSGCLAKRKEQQEC